MGHPSRSLLARRFISDTVSSMAKEKVAVVRPGQKFMHKRKNTIYIVRNIKDQNVVLVSEKGDATMRIQLASLASAAFEPIYD